MVKLLHHDIISSTIETYSNIHATSSSILKIDILLILKSTQTQLSLFLYFKLFNYMVQLESCWVSRNT